MDVRHRQRGRVRAGVWHKPLTFIHYIGFFIFFLLAVLLANAIWRIQDYPGFPSPAVPSLSPSAKPTPLTPYDREFASLNRPDGLLPVTFSPTCTTLATPSELAFVHFPDIARVLSTDLLTHTRHWLLAVSNASYDATRATCRHMRLRWHSDKNPAACKVYVDAALRAFETCCMVLGQYQWTYRKAKLG